MPDPDTPERQLSQFEQRRRLQLAMDELPPEQREVLLLRFGLEDGCQKTLEEVGRRLCVTRERIRQIELKALKKLRAPRCTSYLKACLERGRAGDAADIGEWQ